MSAEIKTKQGLIVEAIEYYKQALILKRDFAFYHTRLGQLYRQKKMQPYALREFEKAVNLDRYGVCYQEHYSDLGGLYKKMGDREESIAQFKKALLIEPEAARDPNWGGLDYLDEILNKMQQDYLTIRDTNPLEAQQVLFILNRVNKYKKKI
jgi:tetratricopeptide (TPR) repeat protein